MKKRLPVIIILFFNFSFGQQFTDLCGDYLGQTPPGDTPVVFAPGIVSTSNLEHSPTIFSNDGNEVYWSSHEFPLDKNEAKLWFMKRINNRWTKPVTIHPFGDSLQITCGGPFLSFDNKKLYFGADMEGINNSDLWFMERQSNKWSKPQKLSSTINTKEIQAQAAYNSDGTVYYLEAKGNYGPFYIFRSRFENGKYHKPEALPSCINSTAPQNWTPYIAPDDSYLIFSSSRAGGFGQGDLYISFHKVNTDTWSEPINLGEPINTRAQERLPGISPDGKYLFFTRWTPDQDQDIFWVSAEIIDRLRGNRDLPK